MNRRAVAAIVRKDLMVVVRSKAVLLPLIIVPLLFLVLLPAMAALAPKLATLPGSSLAGMSTFIEQMPAGLRQTIEGLDESQTLVLLMIVYFMAPMYLILPLMVASVIAADSFAGEKERKTLEALLYTPTTDRELFLGKWLSAWLPALGVSLGGFFVYTLVANLSAWPVMGRVFFPNAMWLVLVLWVAPAVAALGLGVTALVSARVRGFQEAYQLGGVVVLPLVALVIGQVTGVMYFSIGLVWVLGIAVWSIDALLLWLSLKIFRRAGLIDRLG
ncbi:MAG: ABC transporter permease [Trueperaceae bacterium]|nr:MAG: ABC transporter permease [Trueperaceae bacterium]